ncbi:MAG: hypothetical protein ACIAS6_01405 [Phycisphaerales bacterium JB060]
MQRLITSLAVLTLLAPTLALAQDACEPQRLAPPVDPPASKYGSAAATNGRFWFVGDSSARTVCSGSSIGCQSGAVHVYELIDERLEFRETIVPPDVTSGSNFGATVDVEGDRLVVGAYKHIWAGTLLRGAVFVYEFDGEDWVETSRLRPPEQIVDFGRTVVLHGDSMAIWPSQSRDRVYLYGFDGSEWTLSQTLRPDGDPLNWRYGQRMHLDDEWLFIGAPFDGTVTPSGGSVHIYRRQSDGTAQFVQRLAVDFLGRFGHSIGYNGRSLLIGVPGDSPSFDSQGRVWAYEFDGTQWQLVQQIAHSGAGQNQAFGVGLSVHGDTLVAASQNERTPEGLTSVYEFRQQADGAWLEAKRLVPTPPDLTGHLGAGIAIDDDLALVTSLDEYVPGEPNDGAAYLFDLACTDCPADLDADGALSIFDFLAFQTAFDAGCE